MPPPNFCARRQLLYQAQLGETQSFFAGFLENGVFTSADKPRLEAAVTDESLIKALEAILIPYVVFGVGLDLERLGKSRALFCGDANNHPALSDVLPPGGPFPVSPPRGYEVDETVGTAAAYNRYFDRYVVPADVGDGTSGVDAFYQRFPLLDYAVKTVTSHCQYNIQLACERVAADWNDIGKAFFRQKLVRLKKIKTTGNDFHKGGKQVLILTFDLADGTEGRVVYKPSSVEIDCRVVGDSSVFRRVAPQGLKDGTEYTQAKSLTELINDAHPAGQNLGGYTTRALPTYVVLPYNRTAVADAYGYIEFLTHEPALEVLGPQTQMRAIVSRAVRNVSPAVVATADWITPNATDAQVFHHQFGGLMAMAMAVSLCDLHLQNLIVHKRAPHLIDLEEALKRPMTDVTQTYLAGKPSSPIGAFHDPQSPQVSIKDDKTSAMMIQGFPVPPDTAPAACVLYVYGGYRAPAYAAGIKLTDRDGDANRRALVQGFVGVVDTLATPDCNDRVKAWVGDLHATIARYVARATKDYASGARYLFWRYPDTAATPLSRDGSAQAPDGWYDRVKSVDRLGDEEFFFRRAVAFQRTDWTEKNTTPDAWTGAAFALEHPRHVWRDYLNCDVPSFYHTLGSADLLNSRGDVVKVDSALDWQDRNVSSPPPRPPPWRPNANGAYLPEAPVDMIQHQLDLLRKVCWLPSDQRTAGRVQAKKAYLRAALKGIASGADFATVTSHAAVGAGADA